MELRRARPQFSTPLIITRSTETPKTRFTAYQSPRDALVSALSDQYIFIPIPGKVRFSPEMGIEVHYRS